MNKKSVNIQTARFSRIERIYLDYAAATPTASFVKESMEPYWSECFGNPSAMHAEGIQARRAIEEARQTLASVLGIRKQGVTFTGSGTESNNLAISGSIESLVELGTPCKEIEVVTTGIEHPSVSKVLQYWEKRGVQIKYLPLNAEGRIQLEAVEQILSERTRLVTCAYVNSEVGTVQPIGGLVRKVRKFTRAHNTKIVIHTDAAQAPLWLTCAVPTLGVDLMTLDAGKCYGPKGLGVLARQGNVTLCPYVLGGGQEAGLRSGTEATPLIVGGVVAIVKAQEHHKKNNVEVSKLRDYALEKLATIEGVEQNGSQTYRVANNINISIKGVEAEFAVVSLDVAGIAIATRSACSGMEGGGSAVIRYLTGDEERAGTSLRVTLGLETTKEDLDFFVDELKKHISKVEQVKKYLTLD